MEPRNSKEDSQWKASVNKVQRSASLFGLRIPVFPTISYPAYHWDSHIRLVPSFPDKLQTTNLQVCTHYECKGRAQWWVPAAKARFHYYGTLILLISMPKHQCLLSSRFVNVFSCHQFNTNGYSLLSSSFGMLPTSLVYNPIATYLYNNKNRLILSPFYSRPNQK